MADYINREDAIYAAIDGADEWDSGYISSRADVIRAFINDLPAADVRENVRGKWVENRDGDCVCQCCGYEALCFYGGQQCKSDFCPSCGADMRQRDNE